MTTLQSEENVYNTKKSDLIYWLVLYFVIPTEILVALFKRPSSWVQPSYQKRGNMQRFPKLRLQIQRWYYAP